jgi:AcrR family transcriptional regulator
VESRARLLSAGRGPGRPVGADSAETRARILRAARELISERGHEAANFQAIAQRAGLSRPTMHYYFSTKEQIYEVLLAEAHSIVTNCIAEARRKNTLLEQLSAFVARLDFADGSMLRFMITSGLESRRLPGLSTGGTPVAEAVTAFYESMVADAIRRGEIPDDVDATAVVNMLTAMLWGMGFFYSFVHDADETMAIAKQLHRLLVRGLLDGPPSLAANGAKPVVVNGDFTGEGVSSALYRAHRVESFVEGIGRNETLDAVAWPSAGLDT